MTATVYVAVWSNIEYCNSLLIGLPKIRLSSIVLNAALLLKDLHVFLAFINSLNLLLHV